MMSKNSFPAAELSAPAAENKKQQPRGAAYRPLSGALAMIAACFAVTANPLIADEVTKWNEVATRAAFDSGLTANPIIESRVYALTFAAVHDALNGIDRRYRPYTFTGTVTPVASPQAAVATAAHDVLRDQFTQLAISSEDAFIEAAYVASLAQVADGPAKDSGVAVGKAAAAAVLGLRANDGWNKQPVLDSTYTEGTAPGEYRFTPGTPFVLLPKWGNLPPFVLKDGSQFRPRAPYPINSKRYTQDFNEVKQLGGDGVTTLSARTTDQTEIALFWVESSPPMWNRIARTVSSSAGLGLWENGRLFALLNLGLADGYISSFNAKYFYKYWRPVTAIREGDSDGNPDTVGDPNWAPLVVTPPIPDYDSGHAVQGGVAAGILKRFFGTDQVSFRLCSTSLPSDQSCDSSSPKTRFFASFSDAAEENAISRVLVGFHFRNAVEQGLLHGTKIAEWVLSHALRPVGGSDANNGK